MKVKAALAMMTSALLSMGMMVPIAEACTGLRLIAGDDGVVVGRTMEFGFDVDSDAVVVPAGTALTSSLAEPSQGIQYTTKYGMVGANALGLKAIVDGVNEAGLYVGAFYFPGYAGYADPDSSYSDRSLAPEDYGTWLLANFASVEEVKANYDNVVIVPNPNAAIGEESFPGHIVVHDSTGASVVIEPVDGILRIYDNPLGVITNSPTFDWHMTNLRNYINLTATNVPPVPQFGQGSGLRGLPGDFSPPSRFVRAVAFSQFAQELTTVEETVVQVFNIMSAFNIPVGAVRDVHENETHYDYTVWTTASDLENKRWAFRTYNDQSIRSIDVEAALDAAGDEVRVIEMNSEQPIEDVSIQFK